MILSSGLTYWWQTNRITSESLIQQQEKQIQGLESQLNLLQTESQQDKVTLASQDKALTEATQSLQKIQAELASANQELSKAQASIKQQESQLASNSAELEALRNRPPLFSFQSDADIANFASKEAEVKEIVSAAYDYIQELYGRPYLLNQIVIKLTNNLSIAGSSGEIVIENSTQGISITIKMRDFDKAKFQDVNTIIHEMVHGFHGVAVFRNSAYEEGIAVAVADAVMEQMIADQKLPEYDNLYLNLTNAQYLEWNQNLTVPADNNLFYSSPEIGKIYQLVGQAWYNFYQEDPNFFKKLNELYYPKVQSGTVPDVQSIKADITKILTSVNGVPIQHYLNNNRAFNPT